MKPSLDMQKTTRCGRFTVTIVSNTPLTELSTAQDHARSLKNLSDLMIEGSRFALNAAVQLLEAHQVAALASLPAGDRAMNRRKL